MSYELFSVDYGQQYKLLKKKLTFTNVTVSLDSDANSLEDADL